MDPHTRRFRDETNHSDGGAQRDAEFAREDLPAHHSMTARLIPEQQSIRMARSEPSSSPPPPPSPTSSQVSLPAPLTECHCVDPYVEACEFCRRTLPALYFDAEARAEELLELHIRKLFLYRELRWMSRRERFYAQRFMQASKFKIQFMYLEASDYWRAKMREISQRIENVKDIVKYLREKPLYR